MRFSILLLLIPSAAYANELSSLVFAEHFTYSQVESQPLSLKIEGNQRTRTRYIEKLVDDCLDRNNQSLNATLDQPSLHQCLINARLFSEVKLSVEDNTLLVQVEEKWTLIPLPVVTAGSGESRSAGLFVLESNFLGMGMILGAGGSVSNNGTTYFGALSDPSLFFTNWQYNVLLSRQNNEVFLYEGDEETDGLDETVNGYSLGLGYRWYPWNINVAGVRREKEFRKFESYLEPEDNKTTSIKISLRYEKRDYKLYFHEGLSLRGEIDSEVFRTDEIDKATQYEVRAGWQKAVLGQQALQILLIEGGTHGGAAHDSKRLGGGRGFRGIEARTAWSERYHAIAVDYQIPIKRYPSGALTVAPFADAGRIYHRGGNGEVIDYKAFGGGIYFYLRKVALPV